MVTCNASSKIMAAPLRKLTIALLTSYTVTNYLEGVSLSCATAVLKVRTVVILDRRKGRRSKIRTRKKPPITDRSVITVMRSKEVGSRDRRK